MKLEWTWTLVPQIASEYRKQFCILLLWKWNHSQDFFLKKNYPVFDKPRKYKYGCRNIEHIIHLCYFEINLDLLDKCTNLKRNTQAVLISWNGLRGHRRSFRHGDLCKCGEIGSIISILPGKINEGKVGFGWNHGKQAYPDSASLGFSW